jgi:protein-disulfide isomerase
MALAPRFAGASISAGSITAATHTIELYLDYVCPFSGKMWATLSGAVFPQVTGAGGRYASRVRFVVRQQVQPWHPSSTLAHEAGLAVLRLAPERFVDFSTRLFARQRDFFDASVVHAGGARGPAPAGAPHGEARVMDLLRVGDAPGDDGGLNVGNAVTDDLKLQVKTNRLTGVHVTPTVLFNGVVENGISSGFTGDQWLKWLDENLV